MRRPRCRKGGGARGGVSDRPPRSIAQRRVSRAQTGSSAGVGACRRRDAGYRSAPAVGRSCWRVPRVTSLRCARGVCTGLRCSATKGTASESLLAEVPSPGRACKSVGAVLLHGSIASKSGPLMRAETAPGWDPTEGTAMRTIRRAGPLLRRRWPRARCRRAGAEGRLGLTGSGGAVVAGLQSGREPPRSRCLPAVARERAQRSATSPGSLESWRSLQANCDVPRGHRLWRDGR
jgi:hypothetical protein